jgi:hypothetical protein
MNETIKSIIETGERAAVLNEVRRPTMVVAKPVARVVLNVDSAPRGPHSPAKGSVTAFLKPAGQTPLKRNTAQIKTAFPRSAVSSSSRLTLGASASSTRNSTWKCSSCGIALGPQSVVQGTGIIVEGKLSCVDCIKQKNIKRRALKVAPRVIALASALMAVALGVLGVFIPGPVLIMVFAIGIVVLLTGLIGFTMSRNLRFSAVFAGLAAMTFSGWGLMSLSARAETKALSVARTSNIAEFDKDLSTDQISEAIHKIGVIQQKLRATNSADEQKLMSELNGRIDEWVRKNFGELNSQERSTLLLLCGEFGSVTNNSLRKYRAIKIEGGTVSLTMAVAPKDIEPGQQASIPASKDASKIALYLVQHVEGISALELKIVTTAVREEPKDYRTVNLDNKIIDDLKNGNPVPFQQAFSDSSEKK